ncbi:MAG: ribonuclease Z [Chlamydiota bacterium]|jgi:ribonuclease Z
MSLRDIVILGCSSQQPTRKRNHGAYLFRWNEQGLLFDPGEGTQRQFIFAEVAPTVVSHIFVSHFHGDHCLGLGSMLMRLNLDKVKHPIHCFYPASGKKNFDALRYGCIYHENIHVIEHPVKEPGFVYKDDKFLVEATFLEHGVDNIGWRVTEHDKLKFDKAKLHEKKIKGLDVKKLEHDKKITIEGQEVYIDEVSWIEKGKSIAVVIDTRYCENAIQIAKGANVLLTESTYLDSHKDLARKYLHMTAKEAATLAKKAEVKKLILTHFSARYRDLSLFEEEAKEIFPHTFVADDFKRFTF